MRPNVNTLVTGIRNEFSVSLLCVSVVSKSATRHWKKRKTIKGKTDAYPRAVQPNWSSGGFREVQEGWLRSTGQSPQRPWLGSQVLVQC